jgi:myo-inositol-1(or 4)-monophosphatase
MHEELTVAVDAAKNAGAIAKRMLGSIDAVEKTKNNLVTTADLAAEDAIISMIKKHFTAHSILAEEHHETTVVDSGNLWIIDPLDGTNNYAHGIPHFCVSIA